MKATGGRGVDVILEMARTSTSTKTCLLLSRSGRIVVIGSRGRVEIDPRGIMGREAAMLGMMLFNVSRRRPGVDSRGDLARDSRTARSSRSSAGRFRWPMRRKRTRQSWHPARSARSSSCRKFSRSVRL